ncbi:hypothetical protein NC652_034002 [Populus alba x Populus x berolinensis]|uniref:Uncharacterized protein n=1 Tax=Populus alba x Populus x berolinensis TaxID=444605 RepID=A0AAD6LUS6_9ROSI|nr:hypothetical protein NC652_034002 [Populus alba x Populus x berolinensis]KAJ6973710.1 hypothetical protein NC653_033908 [Populus alba x Populus x berolinensis]
MHVTVTNRTLEKDREREEKNKRGENDKIKRKENRGGDDEKETEQNRRRTKKRNRERERTKHRERRRDGHERKTKQKGSQMQGVASKLLPRIPVTSSGGISPNSGCELGKLFIPSPSVYNCTNTVQVLLNYILVVAGVRELFMHACV